MTRSACLEQIMATDSLSSLEAFMAGALDPRRGRAFARRNGFSPRR
jgi:hypothetical protein